MKKYIKEKYADVILQICCEYKNNCGGIDKKAEAAMDRSLETLDKYSNYILGMGYMVDTEDIPYIKGYIDILCRQGEFMSETTLKEVYDYLSVMERADVF